MYTKEQLIEISKQYFKDKDRKVMFCTNDGNFFYEEAFATGHRSSNKSLTVYTITRNDLVSETVAPIKEDVKVSEKVEPKEKAVPKKPANKK